MIFKAALTAGILTALLVMTVLKLPLFLSRLLMRIPSWLQSLSVHFGYGGWLGGVTGHIIAGFMSIPWFFISELWLRPRILNITKPRFGELFKSVVA